MFYGIVNSVNAINQNVAYITIEATNATEVDVVKFDFSASSNFVTWAKKISCTSCNTITDRMYLDTGANRMYTSLIVDVKYLFLVLNITDGTQVSGTGIFKSNQD